MIPREQNMTFCIASSLSFARESAGKHAKNERARHSRGESRVRAAKLQVRGLGKASLPVARARLAPLEYRACSVFFFCVLTRRFSSKRETAVY